MANPTNPFNWQMPTSTDLVTDLPADFEVFGQAVATSMADLLGGTTGQILAKASNTNMDFNWITNDVGDITAVTAGTGITGGGTSGAVTVSFDQANFGGGQTAAGKNGFLNSNLAIWQRGTSLPVTAASLTFYCADRFNAYRAVAGATVSRQTTSDTTNLPTIQYCARVQRDSGNTATNAIFFAQGLESANSIRFAGQTITLSFYARRGANYSSASNGLSVSLQQGTLTDANIISGFGGGLGDIITQTPTLTTTWQRFSYTGTSTATETQIGVLFGYTPSGTAGANDYFEVTGLQVEIGSAATPFQTATGTIQGELAACQRYYYRSNSTVAGARMGIGQCISTTEAIIQTIFPVSMRIPPTALETNGVAANYLVQNAAGSGSACTTIPVFNEATTWTGWAFLTRATGLVAGNACTASTTAANVYFGWSAEL